ncbi:MAG: hypothetical protein NVSMB5_19070 [Candidatus Velthaea sp.]
MYEVFYATTRVARIDAPDRDSAKRGFAAYVLYGDHTRIASDVQLSFGDDAELSPFDPVPAAGTREEMRAWFARREAATETFEPGVFEDPDRTLDSYLRLLAANDPWRLEGHGNRGRTLSAIPVPAGLTTFDDRVRYTFDAARFFDYLRLDIIDALDPLQPQESIRVARLLAVSALHDDALRQIVSSYETIATELRLTERFATPSAIAEPFSVVFAPGEWKQYVAHRHAHPARFLPPADWTSEYPGYGPS